MALATTCPHCKTSFKVVADQLKLRRGLVRCGKCQDVFSGVDYLRYIDDPKPKPVTPVAPVATFESTADLDDLKTAFFLPETIFNASVQIDSMTIQAPVPAYIPSPLVAPKPEPEASKQSTEENPDSARATTKKENLPAPPFSAVEAAALKLSRFPQGLEIDPLSGSSTSAGAGAEPIDPLDQSNDDRQIAAHGEMSAIDYRSQPAKASKLWLLACITLVFMAALQGIIMARNELAIQHPSLQPLLSNLSEAVGLRVELPRKFEALTIESFELQASETSGADQQIYTAQALLRNQASHAIQWPAIELSLTDPSGQLLARKVLLSVDYLGPSELKDQGFAARSEKNIRVRLSLSQLTPNGYSAVLFYP